MNIWKRTKLNTTELYFPHMLPFTNLIKGMDGIQYICFGHQVTQPCLFTYCTDLTSFVLQTCIANISRFKIEKKNKKTTQSGAARSVDPSDPLLRTICKVCCKTSPSGHWSHSFVTLFDIVWNFRVGPVGRGWKNGETCGARRSLTFRAGKLCLIQCGCQVDWHGSMWSSQADPSYCNSEGVSLWWSPLLFKGMGQRRVFCLCPFRTINALD